MITQGLHWLPGRASHRHVSSPPPPGMELEGAIVKAEVSGPLGSSLQLRRGLISASRAWPPSATPTGPGPCLRCPAAFPSLFSARPKCHIIFSPQITFFLQLPLFLPEKNSPTFNCGLQPFLPEMSPTDNAYTTRPNQKAADCSRAS